MYVAEEGLNGQLAVPESALPAVLDGLRAAPEMQGLPQPRKP